MDSFRELGERLKGLQVRTTTLYQGVVTSVEGLTCTVEVDGLQIPDVRLRASTTSQNDDILLTPAVGSVVIIGSLTGDYTQLAVLSMDRVDTIRIHGGKQGGLVLVDQITAKLNTLEGDINALKRAFQSWKPVPRDGGVALKLVTTSWASRSLKETKKMELENKKVTQ